MNRTKLVKNISLLIFCVYLLFLINVLFFSDYYGRTIIKSDHNYNLIPLKEIKRFIKYRKTLGFEGWITNIFGNIAAFVPLGLLLPIINQRYSRLFKVILYSSALSLTVEVVQYFTKVGIMDIDDLILNTIGGVIGYFIYLIIRKIYNINSVNGV